MTADELKEVLRLHKLWLLDDKEGKRANLRSADLRFADLRFADLQSANLRSANLQFAILRSANLQSANLQSANLRSADLRSANLQSANLQFADLQSADLRFAILRSADLQSADFRSADFRSADFRSADLRSADLRSAKNISEAWLDTGEQFKDYLSTIVPALLQAGGKTIEQIVTKGAWECHSWDNCPMAEAFGVHKPEDAPLLLQPRVRQFVQLFDAGLIPCPVVDSK